ncbi:hypothetical protein EJ07DRAFT_151601 [Lizonia empirigonia]|nr:hypothetical protein EJ07DRAFT_151601 [Lizonia empirigonia]
MGLLPPAVLEDVPCLRLRTVISTTGCISHLGGYDRSCAWPACHNQTSPVVPGHGSVLACVTAGSISCRARIEHRMPPRGRAISSSGRKQSAPKLAHKTNVELVDEASLTNGTLCLPSPACYSQSSVTAASALDSCILSSAEPRTAIAFEDSNNYAH